MSQTFSLVCHETKKRVWIGQGWRKMTTFYSGESKTMKNLHQFLQEHMGKNIMLMCDDIHAEICDYEEYDCHENLEKSS